MSTNHAAGRVKRALALLTKLGEPEASRVAVYLGDLEDALAHERGAVAVARIRAYFDGYKAADDKYVDTDVESDDQIWERARKYGGRDR